MTLNSLIFKLKYWFFRSYRDVFREYLNVQLRKSRDKTIRENDRCIMIMAVLFIQSLIRIRVLMDTNLHDKIVWFDFSSIMMNTKMYNFLWIRIFLYSTITLYFETFRINLLLIRFYQRIFFTDFQFTEMLKFNKKSSIFRYMNIIDNFLKLYCEVLLALFLLYGYGTILYKFSMTPYEYIVFHINTIFFSYSAYMSARTLRISLCLILLQLLLFYELYSSLNKFRIFDNIQFSKFWFFHEVLFAAFQLLNKNLGKWFFYIMIAFCSTHAICSIWFILDHIYFNYLLFYTTIMFLFVEFSAFTILHFVLSKFSISLHLSSKQFLHNLPRISLRDYSTQKILQLSNAVFCLHVNKRYGFTYSSFGLITLLTFSKVTIMILFMTF